MLCEMEAVCRDNSAGFEWPGMMRRALHIPVKKKKEFDATFKVAVNSQWLVQEPTTWNWVWNPAFRVIAGDIVVAVETKAKAVAEKAEVIARALDGAAAVDAAEQLQRDLHPAASEVVIVVEGETSEAEPTDADDIAAVMMADKPPAPRQRTAPHAAVVVWDRPHYAKGKMCVPGNHRLIGASITRYNGGEWRAVRLAYTPPLWRDGVLETPPSLVPDPGYHCKCSGCGAEARALLSTLVRAKIDNATNGFICPNCGTEWDRTRLKAGWSPEDADRVLGDDPLSMAAVETTEKPAAFEHPLQGPRLFGVYMSGTAPAVWEPTDKAELKLRDAAKAVGRDVLPWELAAKGPKPDDLWLMAPEFSAGHATRAELDHCEAGFRVRITPSPVDPAVVAELRGALARGEKSCVLV